MTARWTDAYLDILRQYGDLLADGTLATLYEEHGMQTITMIFEQMHAGHTGLPAAAPPALQAFFAQTHALSPDTDLERIARGEEVFRRVAFPAALVLMTKSLPSGYAAPSLTRILNLSGNLIQHPYKRLLGVLQMVVNVSTCHGFESAGEAVITAQKLRLLHAAIRHLVRAYLPDYEARDGVPVNHEDMLATIVAFSYLVIVGLRQLDIALRAEEEEDYCYLWHTYARLMGIEPEAIPHSVADAQVFYDAYARRHYVAAAANPDGVALAAANLKMLRDMLPRSLRLCGLGLMPRLYMQKLLGPEAYARLGLTPIVMHRPLRAVLQHLPAWWLRLSGEFAHHGYDPHEAFGLMIFQKIINRAYNGEVTFSVPETLAALRHMARVDLAT